MRRLPLRSPPRMRGKVIRCEELARVVGITPACAGKRERTVWTTMYRRDHPRVCGEKDLQNAVLGGNLGSPPRVRGKGGVVSINAKQLRITPACAGKRKRS